MGARRMQFGRRRARMPNDFRIVGRRCPRNGELPVISVLLIRGPITNAGFDGSGDKVKNECRSVGAELFKLFLFAVKHPGIVFF